MRSSRPTAARSSARSTSRSITPTTARRSRRSCRAAPRWCSTRSFLPASTPFLEQLYNSGFTKRGGTLVCTYFDENFLNLVPAAHVEGLYSCLDYYQDVSDPFSQKLLDQYDKLYPGNAMFTAGSACTGLYRGLKLWEAAVKEAGSLKQDDVIKALDHAKIAEGPGGPAEMVPGQHHVRMNMYIAQANNGSFKIVKSLGVIDPKERNVPSAVETRRMRAAS